MNKHLDPKSIEPFKVTTGPLPASTKGYSPAPGFPDVMVPYREIALHPSAKEEPVRVYDTSGPYTDAAARIDVRNGLPALRQPWILARGDVEGFFCGVAAGLGLLAPDEQQPVGVPLAHEVRAELRQFAPAGRTLLARRWHPGFLLAGQYGPCCRAARVRPL